jgi:hypothetical protein
MQAAAALTGDPDDPPGDTTTIETGTAHQTSETEDTSQPFTMNVRHASATSMYNEWYGLAEFTGKPISGGINLAQAFHFCREQAVLSYENCDFCH